MSATRLRHLGALVFVAVAAGAIAARADDSGPRPAPRVAVAPAPRAVPRLLRAFPKTAICAPAKPQTGGAPPSKALLDAFAILRRERRPEDALPAEALRALKRYHLEPVAPESARLLRTTPSGGRAWVVPVPDVGAGFPFLCRPRGARAAREGLVVVAVGDAAEGGGGALADLVRGRAPVSADQCAGPDHDLLGVSGIVPDGVPSVFLTAPDGTAVRTDVKDNAYEFLVPHPRAPQQRYIVWTGADGTPHVQPVIASTAPPGRVCEMARKLAARQPRVSVGAGLTPCVVPAAPIPVPPPRRDGTRPRRLAEPILSVGCAPFAPAFAAPPKALPMPKRAPKRG